MTSLENVLDICSARRVRDYYMGFCPCHEDSVRSLKIWTYNNQIYVKCMAGCEWRTVRDKLGLNSARDNGETPQYRIVKEYDYVNREGRTCFTVVRYEPKKFSKYRIINDCKVYGLRAGKYTLRNVGYVPYREGDDENNVIELPDAEPCLYHTYEIATDTDNKPIVFVEGEKDADTVTATGQAIGTCMHDGSGSKWYKRFDELLRGRDVVVIPDCDVPGRQIAAKIVYHMIGVAERLCLFDIDPTRWDGTDISDTGEADLIVSLATKFEGKKTMASYANFQDEPF